MAKKEANSQTQITLRDLMGPQYAYLGFCAGDPNNPIWLCPLEDNLGYSKENPFEPNKILPHRNAEHPLSVQTVIDRLNGIWPLEREKRIQKVQRKIFRLYLLLLYSLVTTQAVYPRGTSGINSVRKIKQLIEEYQFFGKERYGYLLNASPLSFFNLNWAERNWSKVRCIKTSEEQDSLLTYQEWTNLPSFDSYLNWLPKQRRATFSAIRKKYHPYVILCSGLQYMGSLFRIWTTKDEDRTEPEWCNCRQTYSPLLCKWVENGNGNNSTLIVVASTFEQYPSLLNDPETCEEVGKEVRAQISAKYPDIKEWMQPEKFLPVGIDWQKELNI